jgi:hypothetical protein
MLVQNPQITAYACTDENAMKAIEVATAWAART